MSSVSSIQSSSSQTSAVANAVNKELGKDEFLKLLLTELRYQDAMDPVKDKDFIAQMAQFSSLEQTTNLVKAFEKVAERSQNNEALAMLGGKARAVDPDTGQIIDGSVISIKLNGADPELTLLKSDGFVSVVKLSQISDVSI